MPPVAHAPYESEKVDPGHRSLGIVLVAVLTAIIVFVCILMAFSTRNTPMSYDGNKAEESQWFDEGEG